MSKKLSTPISNVPSESSESDSDDDDVEGDVDVEEEVAVEVTEFDSDVDKDANDDVTNQYGNNPWKILTRKQLIVFTQGKKEKDQTRSNKITWMNTIAKRWHVRGQMGKVEAWRRITEKVNAIPHEKTGKIYLFYPNFGEYKKGFMNKRLPDQKNGGNARIEGRNPR